VNSGVGNVGPSGGTPAKVEDVSARAGGKNAERNTEKSAEKDSGTGKSPPAIAEKATPVQHRVKPGETLYSIARDYRTSVPALKQSNPFLAERGLQAGDVLSVQQ